MSAQRTRTISCGVACTPLDSAMGSAVMTTLDVRTGYTTVNLAVYLTRAITMKTGPIVAEGRVVHRGGRAVTTTGRLTDKEERLLAHATGTCILLERQ
jgi:acyl-coenzyme A thioesterase PaaI-like protein